MKKLVTAVFVVGLFYGIVANTQAKTLEQEAFWPVTPGGCSLDFEASPSAIVIDDMNDPEVQLEANWSPAEQGEETTYSGHAKFAVFDVKIAEADTEDVIDVEIDLTIYDSEISEAQSNNLFIYTCEGVDPVCTAILIDVKAAITHEIAQDNDVEVGDVSYASAAGATFLGVWVEGMYPPGSRTGKDNRQNYKLTEICDMYKVRLAEARTTE